MDRESLLVLVRSVWERALRGRACLLGAASPEILPVIHWSRRRYGRGRGRGVCAGLGGINERTSYTVELAGQGPRCVGMRGVWRDSWGEAGVGGCACVEGAERGRCGRLRVAAGGAGVGEGNAGGCVQRSLRGWHLPSQARTFRAVASGLGGCEGIFSRGGRCCSSSSSPPHGL